MKKNMNFKGEILCALTMLYPLYQSIVVLIKVYLQNLSVFDKLVIAQCLIHLPFSVALHVSRAMGDCCHKGRGLIMRRLDYTFIFISNILLAFRLSHSVLYGLVLFHWSAIRGLCTSSGHNRPIFIILPWMKCQSVFSFIY